MCWVTFLVDLGTQALNAWAFAGVEHLDLKRVVISELTHHSTKGVDLTDDDAFRASADMRVAWRIGDHLLVEGAQKGTHSKMRTGCCSFYSSMPTTNDDYIKIHCKTSLFYVFV